MDIRPPSQTDSFLIDSENLPVFLADLFEEPRSQIYGAPLQTFESLRFSVADFSEYRSSDQDHEFLHRILLLSLVVDIDGMECMIFIDVRRKKWALLENFLDSFGGLVSLNDYGKRSVQTIAETFREMARMETDLRPNIIDILVKVYDIRGPRGRVIDPQDVGATLY
jgi:hypothetical protein